MSGSVLSVNVAEIRQVRRGGRLVPTGIWKVPVDGRVAVRGVNIEGDEQADRAVHGGPDKAVYAYAREDTDWWERELGRELRHGAFGENLTLTGVYVSGALIGERPDHDLTIADFAHAYLEDRDALPRLLEVPAVSKMWRDWVRERAA